MREAEENKYRLIGCIVCGLRYVESEQAPPSSGCHGCGSSTMVLEKNLNQQTYDLLLKHGQRCSSEVGVSKGVLE